MSVMQCCQTDCSCDSEEIHT